MGHMIEQMFCHFLEMPLYIAFQMYKDEDCYTELEGMEDLSRLE